MTRYKGDDIEDLSMSIIEQEIANEHKSRYNELEWLVVRRVIHATADYEFAYSYSSNSLIFTCNALNSALDSIEDKCSIVCDTDIIHAALNKSALERLSLRCICKISDQEVIDKARRLNKTRAEIAMRLCSDYIDNGIVVIGNAPTALYELINMIEEGYVRPRLIIGIPVGFVSAVESKESLIELGKKRSGIEYITNRGRKGGSIVAAAILNALFKIYMNKGLKLNK